MSLQKKQLSTVLGALLLAATLIYFGSQKAEANPSDFSVPCATAEATTTIRFMSPGAATTTLTCALAVNNYAADTAALLVYYTATSTSSHLDWFYEYSQDGISWYRDNLTEFATTSQSVYATEGRLNHWRYASTTVGGAPGVGTSVVGAKIFEVETPTKYIRAVFHVPIGASNGAVWAQFIPKREI